MNLVVMLHITQTNPLQTEMSKEDSSHQRQINTATQPQTVIVRGRQQGEHHPQWTSKSTEKRVPRAILQGLQVTNHKDQPLQHPQTQAGGPSQAPPVTKPSTSHQNPLECNDTNGFTKAPAIGKRPRCYQIKEGIGQIQVLLLSLLTHQRTLLYVPQCGESGHWSRKLFHIIIFVIFVG